MSYGQPESSTGEETASRVHVCWPDLPHVGSRPDVALGFLPSVSLQRVRACFIKAKNQEGNLETKK